MKFIDNWCYTLTDAITPSAVELPLPSEAVTRLALVEGDEYMLTIVAALDPLTNAAFEHVRLTGTATGYDLARGEQGSTAREWPAGSVVLCGVTAALLSELLGGSAGGGVTVGSAPPTAAPATDGELYLDASAPAVFAPLGDLSGWQQVSGARYTQTLEDDGTETLMVADEFVRDISLYPVGDEFAGVIRVQLPPFAAGLGAYESLRLDAFVTGSPGWQLLLDFTPIAQRLALDGFTFAIAGATASVSYNEVTLDAVPGLHLEINAGLQSADVGNRYGIVRIEATELPAYAWVSGPAYIPA